ncbi:MAG: nitrophenyl compound nitroreductase subunit ArsF family protein [Tenuifilaceae bacterium]
MKKSLLIIALAILSVSFGSCGNTTTQAEEKKSAEVTESVPAIQILYFHGDRRCPTCIKVGEVSLSLFDSKYGKNSFVVYKDVNIDKEENKAIAEKYQVTGSSLMIDVNGEVKNITVDAFKYAKTDPAKLETIITDIIEKGLTK